MMTRARSIASLPLRAGRAGVRGAFTLIELMVAVGAIALIAVGLAAVFSSVGDTVTGGRSVSGFTAYAALLERQLRDDISQMSRDGFLLIVNQHAEQGADIALYPGQPPAQQRPRRIDEMVFFRKGDFVSGREPLGPGYTARGNSAMIYYGHGARQPVDERVNSTYVFPRATDANDNTGPLGDPASLGAGFPNPNRYASDWGLLRVPLVLAGHGGADEDRSPLFQLQDLFLRDSDIQVGGQPAAKSLFRSLERLGAPPPVRTVRSAAMSAQERGNLLRTSGLVDVVTSDIDEVRRSVMSSPAAIGAGPSYDLKTPADITEADLPTLTDAYPGVVAPFAVQQAWMLDALPAPSVGFIAAPAGSPWSPGTSYPPEWAPQNPVARVRYEIAPPAYLEPMDLTGRPLERAVRLADQMALTANLLVPRCTEFIVEWSFGKVAADGSLIWHGIERSVDLDADGREDPEEVVARPYLNDNDDVRFALPYRLLEPAPLGGIPGFAGGGDLYGSYPVDPQLIHGFETEAANDKWTFQRSNSDGVLASFFGYLDPTFNPAQPSQRLGMPPLGGAFAAAPPAAADHLPWAWPELIRITVSLADPADPAVEQTFQFVFQAPGNPAP